MHPLLHSLRTGQQSATAWLVAELGFSSILFLSLLVTSFCATDVKPTD